MDQKIKSLLDSLDYTRSEFWNISKETGLFLNKLIRATPSIKTILEIGTSNGVSAIYMAEALKAKKEELLEIKSKNFLPKNIPLSKETIAVKSRVSQKPNSKKTFHLYTIESHKKLRYKLATENFKKAGLTQYITQILGHAPEVIPKNPKYFDLIFLDATKYEHTDYLKAILPRTYFNSRTSKGSIIITDNAISHKKNLKPYFKEVKKLKKFKTHLIKISSGLLVSERVE